MASGTALANSSSEGRPVPQPITMVATPKAQNDRIACLILTTTHRDSEIFGRAREKIDLFVMAG
jgi:hypothetical protein